MVWTTEGARVVAGEASSGVKYPSTSSGSLSGSLLVLVVVFVVVAAVVVDCGGCVD